MNSHVTPLRVRCCHASSRLQCYATDDSDAAHCRQGCTFVNQYVVVKTLGQGAYARVKLALSSADQRLYALKLIRRARLRPALPHAPGGAGGGVATADGCPSQEARLMARLDHPNILRLVEVIGAQRPVSANAGTVKVIVGSAVGLACTDAVWFGRTQPAQVRTSAPVAVGCDVGLPCQLTAALLQISFLRWGQAPMQTICAHASCLCAHGDFSGLFGAEDAGGRKALLALEYVAGGPVLAACAQLPEAVAREFFRDMLKA
jgi:serine/threonine protein kinase